MWERLTCYRDQIVASDASGQLMVEVKEGTKQLTLNQRAAGSIPARPPYFSTTYAHPAKTPSGEKPVLKAINGVNMLFG